MRVHSVASTSPCALGPRMMKGKEKLKDGLDPGLGDTIISRITSVETTLGEHSKFLKEILDLLRKGKIEENTNEYALNTTVPSKRRKRSTLETNSSSQFATEDSTSQTTKIEDTPQDESSEEEEKHPAQAIKKRNKKIYPPSSRELRSRSNSITSITSMDIDSSSSSSPSPSPSPSPSSSDDDNPVPSSSRKPRPRSPTPKFAYSSTRLKSDKNEAMDFPDPPEVRGIKKKKTTVDSPAPVPQLSITPSNPRSNKRKIKGSSSIESNEADIPSSPEKTPEEPRVSPRTRSSTSINTTPSLSDTAKSPANGNKPKPSSAPNTPLPSKKDSINLPKTNNKVTSPEINSQGRHSIRESKKTEKFVPEGCANNNDTNKKNNNKKEQDSQPKDKPEPPKSKNKKNKSFESASDLEKESEKPSVSKKSSKHSKAKVDKADKEAEEDKVDKSEKEIKGKKGKKKSDKKEEETEGNTNNDREEGNEVDKSEKEVKGKKGRKKGNDKKDEETEVANNDLEEGEEIDKAEKDVKGKRGKKKSDKKEEEEATGDNTDNNLEEGKTKKPRVKNSSKKVDTDDAYEPEEEEEEEEESNLKKKRRITRSLSQDNTNNDTNNNATNNTNNEINNSFEISQRKTPIRTYTRKAASAPSSSSKPILSPKIPASQSGSSSIPAPALSLSPSPSPSPSPSATQTHPPLQVSIPSTTISPFKFTPPSSPCAVPSLPPIFAVPTSPHRSPRTCRSPSPSFHELNNLFSPSHLPPPPPSLNVLDIFDSTSTNIKPQGYHSPPRPKSPSPLFEPTLSISSISSPTHTPLSPSSSPSSSRPPLSPRKSSIDFLLVNEQEKRQHTEYYFQLIAPTFNKSVEEENAIQKKYTQGEIEQSLLLDGERLFCDACSTGIPDRYWSFKTEEQLQATKNKKERACVIAVQDALDWYRMANAEARLSLSVQQQVIMTCHRCKVVKTEFVVCECLRKWCYPCLEKTNSNAKQAKEPGWRCAFCLDKCKVERIDQSQLSGDDFGFDLCLDCGDKWNSRKDILTLVRATETHFPEFKNNNKNNNNNNNDNNNNNNNTTENKDNKNNKDKGEDQEKDKKDKKHKKGKKEKNKSINKKDTGVFRVPISYHKIMEYMKIRRVFPQSFVLVCKKTNDWVEKHKSLAVGKSYEPKRPLGWNPVSLATLEWFQSQWREGVPVVVSQCKERLHLQWSPEEFMMQCGVEKHEMVDCRDSCTIDQLTVKEFFDGYLDYDARHSDNSNHKMRLKLKDWPASEDFATKLPEHFEDLMNALPFGEYVRPTGSLNMISMLPSNANKPDLGPKCYIAYENTMTNLHCDMSDAVNLLVHVGSASPTSSSPLLSRKPNNIDLPKSKPTKTAGALWHIFRKEDVPAISKFLKSLDQKPEVSILDHSIYLTDELLTKLESSCAVVPHVIYQELGDAVFIPAGCPHQVTNIRCCIKVAEDFVSPENLEHCVELTNQFRTLPATHKFRKDRLQVKTILYHAIEHAVNELMP